MARLDPQITTLDVLTEAEGLLGAAGHDLRLRAGVFELDVDEAAGTIGARVEAASLRVASARKGDRDLPDALSAGDRGKIDASVRDDVLHTRRYPEIRFSGTLQRSGERLSLAGRLSLHGTERPVACEVRREGAHWVAEFDLDQPDYGIRPFSALLGTLKVRPKVRVRVRAPAS